jgi:amidophosphoribosyltransferase
MCGFIGVAGVPFAVREVYEGLLTIQHRGQDSAGIITYDGRFHIKKGEGLVRDIFSAANMERLKGSLAVGHVRYPTVGSGGGEDAQPFTVNYPFGIVMAHNGNVANYDELCTELAKGERRHLYSGCDVEVILNVFANALAEHGSHGFSLEAYHAAVAEVYRVVRGAYSVVGYVAGHGLFAFRDPYGIKPIVVGRKTTVHGEAHAVASESVVLTNLGYDILPHGNPGEAVFIDLEGEPHWTQIAEPNHHPCLFEFVYFARPDSYLEGASVYRSRLKMGERLADMFKKTGLQADVVIPVPDSARTSALAMAQKLGMPYREGLVKNLIVDDSIVRGTTSKQIVQLARSAGARRVLFASTSPPLLYPCVYGIDMSTRRDFVARDRTHQEIARFLGADAVVYQTLDDLMAAVQDGNPALQKMCAACFSGDYPTGDITGEMLLQIEQERTVSHG